MTLLVFLLLASRWVLRFGSRLPVGFGFYFFVVLELVHGTILIVPSTKRNPAGNLIAAPNILMI